MPEPPRFKPRSAYYDGWFYAAVVESTMRNLHGLIAKSIPDDSRVLDACCGTGGLARRLASRCQEVVGVDLSSRQIRQARRAAARRGLQNLSFSVGDVAHLDQFADGSFSIATLVMALHEMPPGVRPQVVGELLRVAKTLVVVDFMAPMRWNPAGLRNRFMELAAGYRHFQYYRDYSSNGGLPAIFRKIGAQIDNQRVTDSGNLLICQVASRT